MSDIPEKNSLKMESISGPKSGGLSVVMNINNATSKPYLETIVSALPVADEVVIREGANNDGVFTNLTRFEKNYADIEWKLIQDSEYPSEINNAPHSEKFNEQRYGENKAIQEASKKYVLLLKPGEAFRWSDLQHLKLVKSDKVEFVLKEVMVSSVRDAARTVRLAENKDLFSNGVGLDVEKGSDLVESNIRIYSTHSLDKPDGIDEKLPEIWEGAFDKDRYTARNKLYNLDLSKIV